MSSKNEFTGLRVQKFTWDQAIDGNLTNNASTAIGRLPDNAIILRGWGHVVTDVVDADAGDDSTIAVGVTGSTTGLLAATAVSTLEAGYLFCLLPNNFALDGNSLTAANMAIARDATILLQNGIKEVLLTTGDDVAISAGKINIWLEYVISE